MQKWSVLVSSFVTLSLFALSPHCFAQGVDPQPLPKERTVEEAVALYSPAVEQSILPYFERAGMPYPPPQLSLLGFKEEQRLEVWAGHDNRWTFVLAYPIAAASGRPGPKLREGDYQVPEGMYKIAAFNPNSRFHLSLKIDYPNEFDRQQAAREGRVQLGGDIFIHGHEASTGCLAVGNIAIEELFVLVARVGMEQVSVLIAPHDFRQQPRLPHRALPRWVTGLYSDLQRTLEQFRP